ncbi:hypothetical protein [Nocardiopsis sp. FIRDI 009]|uniref:hypothetical protein n=1 Tax=Nocardiopsis sp. FIRDI 009 TaxID=714197 RepID=UPI000E25326B|nr:hypothetical protein [Nocardiopsis sp. FIRDI 009]
MPATSRSGRAARVVSAVCALAPSMLGLPLLAGAFLATLWLFGAAPAHADTLDLDGARPLSDTVGEVVRVADPVTATLGTVHRGLEEHAERTAEAAEGLSDPAQAVSEVGVGARHVVEEIRPDRWDAPAAEPLPELAAGPEEGATRAPREASAPAEEGAVSPAPAAADADPAPAPEPTRWHAAAEATADDAPHRADESPRAHPRDTERLGGHLTTGSAPTSGNPSAAPGVAGYLTSTPLAAPASVPARPVDARLHSVPVDPADDPTVSPD